METKANQDEFSLWLKANPAWLLSRDGKEWLKSRAGENWLTSTNGYDWLKTDNGRDWIRDNTNYWLMIDGLSWFKTEDGQKWFLSGDGINSKNKPWFLSTMIGKEWLLSEDGLDWLKTDSGLGWLKTDSGLDWLKESTYWILPDGQKWLKTNDGEKWFWSNTGQVCVRKLFSVFPGVKLNQYDINSKSKWSFLKTDLGQRWLNSNQGREWLKSSSGISYTGAVPSNLSKVSITERCCDSVSETQTTSTSGKSNTMLDIVLITLFFLISIVFVKNNWQEVKTISGINRLQTFIEKISKPPIPDKSRTKRKSKHRHKTYDD